MRRRARARRRCLAAGAVALACSCTTLGPVPRSHERLQCHDDCLVEVTNRLRAPVEVVYFTADVASPRTLGIVSAGGRSVFVVPEPVMPARVEVHLRGASDVIVSCAGVGPPDPTALRLVCTTAAR